MRRHVVGLHDLAPTLLALTRASAPRRFTIDGRSLVPLMRDGTGTGTGRDLLIESLDKDSTWRSYDAIRTTSGYVYVDVRRRGTELYDLTSDPSQVNNLAGLPAHAGLEQPAGPSARAGPRLRRARAAAEPLGALLAPGVAEAVRVDMRLVTDSAARPPSARAGTGPAARGGDDRDGLGGDRAGRRGCRSRTGEHTGEGRTFSAARPPLRVVEVDGLAPGSAERTRCGSTTATGTARVAAARLDLPASRIRTLDPCRPLRLVFGSCRTSVPHDAEHNRRTGSTRCVRTRCDARTRPGASPRWPGDLAVDAAVPRRPGLRRRDLATRCRTFIASRRDIEQPPGKELKDYEEYAHLYRLAWTDPANRWLLSTLPSAMIFDDHDIRDDWNTSRRWRDEMDATSWWHGRIVGGLASYWVYQHLGNLSPGRARRTTRSGRAGAPATTGREHDVGDSPGRVRRAGRRTTPDATGGATRRDLGGQPAGRPRLPGGAGARRRTTGAMLDDGEMAWFDDRCRGDVDHLLHRDLAAVPAADGPAPPGGMGRGGRRGRLGTAAARMGETAAAGGRPRALGGVPEALPAGRAAGADGGPRRARPAPATVMFLAGDVHHSYLAEAPGRRVGQPAERRICCRRCARRSATRCPARCGSSPPRRRPTAWPTRSAAPWPACAKVPDPPFRWSMRRRAVVRQRDRDPRPRRAACAGVSWLTADFRDEGPNRRRRSSARPRCAAPVTFR